MTWTIASREIDLLLVAAATAALIFAGVSGPAAAGQVGADFNGDGRDDLAIGVGGEDLPDGVGGSIVNAGAVNVLYGTNSGLSAEGDQLWHQNKKRVKNSARPFDGFGGVLP